MTGVRTRKRIADKDVIKVGIEIIRARGVKASGAIARIGKYNNYLLSKKELTKPRLASQSKTCERNAIAGKMRKLYKLFPFVRISPRGLEDLHSCASKAVSESIRSKDLLNELCLAESGFTWDFFLKTKKTFLKEIDQLYSRNKCHELIAIRAMGHFKLHPDYALEVVGELLLEYKDNLPLDKSIFMLCLRKKLYLAGREKHSVKMERVKRAYFDKGETYEVAARTYRSKMVKNVGSGVGGSKPAEEYLKMGKKDRHNRLKLFAPDGSWEVENKHLFANCSSR